MQKQHTMNKNIKSSMFKKDPYLFFFLVAVWGFVALFILFPFIKLFISAFIIDGKLSFIGIKENIGDRYTIKALFNSLILATSVSITGTVLGYLFALIVTRTSVPKILKVLISAITLLPLISPPFTSSISLTLALGPNGMLLNFFGIDNLNIYGFLGTWLSESLTYFPVAFMVISAVLNTMNASLDDAAMSLGASKARVLKTVTLPLSIPAIGNSILLLFSSSLADFATPLILGGQSFPVLPTQAYLQITGLFDIHGGASISFLLLVPALIVFWLQRMVVGNKSFVTVTGKNGAQSNFVKLPNSISFIMWIICSIVIAFILYLYFIILWGSLIQTWGIDNSITFKNYKYVFTYGHKAITDTLKIGITSTLLGTLLGVIIGYIVERKNFMSKRALDIASMMNYALPGTVVGIAYIVAFNGKPFVLTGTMTILVAAYIFRYYATGIRSVMTSLQQIDPALEEASMSLGASSARTFTHITVPLIIPAVLTGMRYLFIHCMTAISATIFLVSVRWTLLTTRILESMTELQFSQACAFSVVLIVIVFVADAFMNFMLKTYSNHFKKNSKETQ
ncbi:MAG: iron ABC transporter permease [Sphaerochaetaceae bacterium]|nr:iron ABC transporter permease [Sphaerochaetaceae bacterium]